jgi:hypothetical protein
MNAKNNHRQLCKKLIVKKINERHWLQDTEITFINNFQIS